MSPASAYSIADLARLTGANVRTIRYYLAQGLLPASGESGPGAHYGDGHLNRLLLTKRLQEQHLPLAEIRRRLADLTDADVATFVAAPPEPERATTSSALDYVRTVLGTAPARHPGASLASLAGPARTPAPAEAREPAPIPPPSATPPSAATPLTAPAGRHGPSLLRRAVDASKVIVSEAPAMPRMRNEPADDSASPGAPAAAASTAASAAAPAPAQEPPGPERSQWERLALGPNVEIHIRRPLSRLEQRRVERLITIARQVLKEDTK